ncbi:MAG: 5-methyltetrahydropteroyltriglutamate--homocysteine S-methyltransferase [Thermomicrobiales bacterium]|nr:5-methyltetrahydropteroyltriglutamate--homocysteine S-methyltransferase [Thermomicrobiales bacterium]
MAISTIAGYPRIGRDRELKWATERYWAGKIDADELQRVAAELRKTHWQSQRDAGIDLVGVNDFSFYDQMLDMSVLLGAVPSRFGTGPVDLDTYFRMARGDGQTGGVAALDMTKWFDTNYHYLVPELAADQTFRLTPDKPLAELAEAQALGLTAKVILIGPVTYLRLAELDGGGDPLDLLPNLLPVYAELIAKLAAAGAEWIELHEPVLVRDRDAAIERALTTAYTELARAAGSARLLVHVPYGDPKSQLATLMSLPVAGIGLDLTRSPGLIDRLTSNPWPGELLLGAGIVDGRNVWIANLEKSVADLQQLAAHAGAGNLLVTSSCSLLHVPYDASRETALDPELQSWLAFAEQKLAEISLLTNAVNGQVDEPAIAANRQVLDARATSRLRTDPAVQARVEQLRDEDRRRSTPAPERAALQDTSLDLPSLPTTTIGSFPQTSDLRKARRALDKGELSLEEYDATIAESIGATVAFQEQIELDVLVHGEPERNDMVQYFAEQLAGFAATEHGWVQSYGTRCVRPPVIFADVSRPNPMSVRWSTYAQSLTKRPVKGMLTGPVTMLNWSFVRDDQPRSATCEQIALAIQDEVRDLIDAGLTVIQIDEPALREGLPLDRDEWSDYLAWATACFRLSEAVAPAEIQIHTHMCYSEFGDVIEAIDALDADVLSIENARSALEMLSVFRDFDYRKGVGPGVYDVHSPRVPTVDEFVEVIAATVDYLGPDRVWINPDCGLKTRGEREVSESLTNLVAATRIVRDSLAARSGATAGSTAQ